MQTKTNKAVSFLRSGDFRSALAIISAFRIGFTKEEKRTLEIAKECLSGNEPFYRSIGVDTQSEIEKSKKIIELKYLK
jgi:hypothetical protein